MKYKRTLTRISIGFSFSGVASQLEDWCLVEVTIVVGSVHVAHVARVSPGSVHHGFSIGRSLAIAVAVGVSVPLVVHVVHAVSVPLVVHVVHVGVSVPLVVHVVHVPVVIHVVARVHVHFPVVVHVVPVVTRVHGPVVTLRVTIAVGAVVGISISFSDSSGFSISRSLSIVVSLLHTRSVPHVPVHVHVVHVV